MFGVLRRSLEEFKRDARFTASNTAFFTAVLVHYIQDANQPLHATNNFDGQLTGQNGVHARFETELFERYESKLSVNPAPAKGISNARDASFDALLASYQLVDAVLKADKDAIEGKDAYDNEYFDKFFAAVRPVLEKQLAA